MTKLVREAWRETVRLLRESQLPRPTREARWILSTVLHTEPSRLHLFWDTLLTPGSQDTLDRMIEQRRAGVPLQYVLGEWEFMSCVLQVREGVFIPRLDTEAWVEEVISWGREHLKGRAGRLLDLCCGSGAIACASAFWIPELTVLGVDISEGAVALSRCNARLLGIEHRTQFIVSDLFTQCPPPTAEQFDLIVSNPPYIRDEDWAGLPDEVRRFEPKRALVGGEDGLDFIRRILAEGRDFLEKDGIMVIEHSPEQGNPIEALLRQDGFFELERTMIDYSGQVRASVLSLARNGRVGDTRRGHGGHAFS